MFAVRKILVSIFDGVSNGGALREICDLAGGFTGGKFTEQHHKKSLKRNATLLYTSGKWSYHNP
ncbi:hypothetical protein GZ353_003284 [Salmonella enterica]|nr:hypothetical protein [Salmonella enterica]EEG3322643.1 hypothetical protein [Salmonella enterica]